MFLKLPDLRIGVAMVFLAWLAGGPASIAATDQPPPVAGLVIDYGNGAETYALVPLDGQDQTGLDLLERSGLDLLTVGSGGWGVAVCAIQGVGCDLSACRVRLCQTSDPTSPYWRYLQAPDEPGSNWVFVNRGAGTNPVEPGDVDAWFWLGTRPDAASVTLEDIASRLDVDLTAIGDTPIVRTFGSLPSSATPPPTWGSILAASGIVVATAVVGLVAVRQNRLAR